MLICYYRPHMTNKIEQPTALPYLTLRNYSYDYESGEVLVINSGAPIIPHIDYQRFYEAVKDRILPDGVVLMEEGVKTEERVPVDEKGFSTEQERLDLIEQLADTVHLRGAWASNYYANLEAAAYHEGMTARALAPYRQQQAILDAVLHLAQKSSERALLPHEYHRRISSSRL